VTTRAYSVSTGAPSQIRGVVLTVEPSTWEFERLEANIALSRLNNVKPFNVALGSRVGEARLTVAQARHAGTNAIETDDGGESPAAWASSRETVSVETIDALVAQSGLARLDLVKLDIEAPKLMRSGAQGRRSRTSARRSCSRRRRNAWPARAEPRRNLRRLSASSITRPGSSTPARHSCAPRSCPTSRRETRSPRLEGGDRRCSASPNWPRFRE
jgi:FkbM family methyltransferase